MTQRFTTPALLALTSALALGLTACGPKPAEQPADAAPTEAQTATSDPAAAGSTADRGGGWDAPMTLTAMQVRSDERFASADADHDGVITTAELEAMADARGGPGGRGGGRGLARADADGDGRVTREEARAQVAERFARMDTNGDGTISEDERPQRGFGRGGPDSGSDGSPPPAE